MQDPKEGKNLIILGIVAVVGIVGIVAVFGLLYGGVPSGDFGEFEVAVDETDLAGEAGKVLCRDSDGGLNYYEAGVVTRRNGVFEDLCANQQRVAEYYCSKNNVKKKIYTCPSGCSEGACLRGPVCGDNACDTANGENSRNCPQDCAVGAGEYVKCVFNGKGLTSVQSCSNLEIKGVGCSGVGSCDAGFIAGPKGMKLTWRSSCTPNYAYTTIDGVDEKAVFDCRPCKDSDGGIDYNVRGDLTVLNISASDWCSDSSTLTELFCTGNFDWDFENYACPYGCDNGACSNEPIEEPPVGPTEPPQV